ncbi:hypothetical protein PG996_007606 [Apiospora saccharicola]|uniref:Uncharacterized protein n=1 Tax=Apiospora saccharicola TaxID=335842 RepID=A0ABR1VES3_9PEZI
MLRPPRRLPGGMGGGLLPVPLPLAYAQDALAGQGGPALAVPCFPDPARRRPARVVPPLPPGEDSYPTDDDYARLFRFVGSVTDGPRREDLVASVRSLCVGHPSRTDRDKRWHSWHYSLSSTDAALHLRGFLAVFPPGSRYEASSSPGLFSKVDLIGGLLRLLPSLTELSLGNELLEPFEDYIPAYLEQEDYLCLRTFEVSTNAAGHSTYFKLKKLSKLEGRIIELSRDLRVLKLHLCDSLGLGRNAGDGDKEGLSPKFSLPHLQSLRITEGRLDADELCHLLSACPAAGSLREFVYDAAEVYLHVLHNCTGDSFRTPAENWMRTRKPDVDPSAVIAALEHLQPKLESLHLNVHQFMDIPHKGPFAPLRSLSDFTALRNLLLDWRSICGGYANQNDTDDTQRLVRLLPESIRSLYIVGCAQEIHPQRLGRSLEGLAAARDRGRFADLQRVGCDIRRSYRYWGTSSKNRDDPGGAGLNAAWKDMFGVGGVQFEYDLGWEGSPSPGGTYYDDTGYRESSGPFSPPISMSDYEIDEDL